MKPNLLFPAYFKYIGWLLAVPGLVLGYFVVFWDYKIRGFELLVNLIDRNYPENFTNELALALAITGLSFIFFAKTEHQRDTTSRLRSESIFWSILANYICYALYLLFWSKIKYTLETWFGYGHSTIIFGPDYSSVNLVAPLIICVLRFYYLIYRLKRWPVTKPLVLLPYKPYRVLGVWLSMLIILFIVFSYVANHFHKYPVFVDQSFNAIIFLPFTLLLWTYSLNKAEDDQCYSIRLQSIRFAVYINYGMLFLLNLVLYDWNFLYVEYINMVTIPILFILCFQYQLYKHRKIQQTIILA